MVIEDGSVERVNMLRAKYLQHIQEHAPDWYNEEYPTRKLKEKIVDHFGDRLKFWQPSRRDTSELVYAADLNTGEAVQAVYEATASESKIVADAASIFRRDNLTAHSKMKDNAPRPPSPSYLQLESTKPPQSLLEFMSLVISSKSLKAAGSKTARLSGSFAEDVSCAATRGRWTVPKHLLRGVTMHHLTGKADVVTILHRYGHCQSYTRLLELETAMANQIQLRDSLLPANISTTGSKVVHMCWDNFDLNEETPSGGGTTHTTHGIVVQEVDNNAVVVDESNSVPRTKERSFKPSVMETLPPVS